MLAIFQLGLAESERDAVKTVTVIKEGELSKVSLNLPNDPLFET